MTQTAPRRSCKCGLHRSATMSDWLSTSVAAQAAPSPADPSHPNSIAKESEADVHPKRSEVILRTGVLEAFHFPRDIGNRRGPQLRPRVELGLHGLNR